MPNKNKNSRNSSLKSTASTASTPSVSASADDDDFGGLLAKMKGPQKPQKQRETPSPEPVETPSTPVKQPWEEFNMTEEEFHAMIERVKKREKEYNKECYEQYLLAEWESPSFWRRRLESLEKEREVFNTKRSWSAFDMEVVEQIDKDIQECETKLDSIFDETDRIENEYD